MRHQPPPPPPDPVRRGLWDPAAVVCGGRGVEGRGTGRPAVRGMRLAGAGPRSAACTIGTGLLLPESPSHCAANPKGANPPPSSARAAGERDARCSVPVVGRWLEGNERAVRAVLCAVCARCARFGARCFFTHHFFI